MTSTELAPRVLDRLDDDGRALLFTDARTANSFAATPVTDAELAEIWELAKWGPSAANTQPLRVLYVRTDEGRARLVEHMSDGNKDKTLAAPAVAVLAVDTQFYEHIPNVFPIRPEMRDYFANDLDAADGTSRFNAALQAGYFILAVRAAGLAAGPMAGFDKAGVDAEFFPDGRFKSILVVNIGHPGENPWFDRLPRLEHADAVQYA
jgi:3-hydroxypropanoate dehydrogenase